MKKIIFIVIGVIVLAVAGFFVWRKFSPLQFLYPTPSSNTFSQNVTTTSETGDIQYLIFWPPIPGTANNYEARIKDFTAKIETTGDGKTRQLGFGYGIPIFTADESKIPQAIKMGFDMARQTNVAVHFNVDDHITWDERPDLWNWYDPAKKGYNPDNKKNVEWYDWEGMPNKHRYFSPAGVAQSSPHMCYNSPTVQKEITRIVSTIVGPALQSEIKKLKDEHKEYLFAGITVGAEAGFDDYTNFPTLTDLRKMKAKNMIDPTAYSMMYSAEEAMKEDNAPHSRVGYCDLTNAGYNKSNPPADFQKALAQINKEFIGFWDKQFVDAGISSSRLYTHIAAQPHQDNTNAPIDIAFNIYARPGWTTYPDGTLGQGFQPLYDELAKHGNPAWGGVEANNNNIGSEGKVRSSWETYLAWHYNHGAKLVGINVGASEATLSAKLMDAYGDEAVAAYQKFLRGEKLSEK